MGIFFPGRDIYNWNCIYFDQLPGRQSSAYKSGEYIEE